MSYRTVDPAEGRALVDGGWTYLDVRTVDEFEVGHAPGAYNVPFAIIDRELGRMVPNPDFCEVVKKTFEPGTKLMLACAAGGRSMHACEALVGEGYTELVNMHGGFSGARDQAGNIVQDGWEALGFPTTDDADPDRAYDTLRSTE